MAKLCNRSLKPNPFTTYRDPQTGQWVVVPIEERLREKVTASTHYSLNGGDRQEEQPYMAPVSSNSSGD